MFRARAVDDDVVVVAVVLTLKKQNVDYLPIDIYIYADDRISYSIFLA